jgi:hypothetical protein
VKRRVAAWETSRICQELILEMVEGVGKASLARMMISLVAEVVERAEMAGHLKNLILEITNYGSEVRDKVERGLRKGRLEEELSMKKKMMLAEMDREERLREKAKKKAAWLEMYYMKESAKMTTMMGMLTVVDWEESMEVDRPVRDMTVDVDGDTIMTDKSGRKSYFAYKSKNCIL